jgi:hypothetical protein
MINTQTNTIIVALITVIFLALPAFSFAASPDISKLESQFQLLMERFQSFKSGLGSNGSSTPGTRPEKDRTASSTVNRTCMATAVATREASIKTAWTTFNTAMMSSLDKRSTALVAAWNNSDGSGTAGKTAWSNWRNESKAAHSKLRSDRKAAWDTFRKTAKDSCKVTTPKEEDTTKESKDTISL